MTYNVFSGMLNPTQSINQSVVTVDRGRGGSDQVFYHDQLNACNTQHT